MIQLKKKDILGGTKTRLELWEEHLKRPNHSLGKSMKVLGEPYLGWPLAPSFRWQIVWIALACSCVGTKNLQKMWDGPFWEGVWPCLDPWDSVRLRTPRKCGPAWRALFLSLSRREPVVALHDVSSNSFVSAETLKACALIGLHLFGSIR